MNKRNLLARVRVIIVSVALVICFIAIVAAGLGLAANVGAWEGGGSYKVQIDDTARNLAERWEVHEQAVQLFPGQNAAVLEPCYCEEGDKPSGLAVVCYRCGGGTAGDCHLVFGSCESPQLP